MSRRGNEFPRDNGSISIVYRENVLPTSMYLHLRIQLLSPHSNISYPQLSAVGFTDSDWAGNHTTRKSIGRSVFGLGYIDGNNELVTSGLIHWQAKSQSVVALSTLEAEYIACSHATRESLWLKRITKKAADRISVQVSEGPVPIGCDSQGDLK
jgi:hypothetical protein